MARYFDVNRAKQMPKRLTTSSDWFGNGIPDFRASRQQKDRIDERT
jgi:hypothetical protein